MRKAEEATTATGIVASVDAIAVAAVAIVAGHFPTTDKSCDFQADVIKFDHLNRGNAS